MSNSIPPFSKEIEFCYRFSLESLEIEAGFMYFDPNHYLNHGQPVVRQNVVYEGGGHTELERHTWVGDCEGIA